jgi:hypothetical protein
MVLFGMFLFYLVLVTSGVVLRYWYPDIPATDSGIILGAIGCVGFGGMAVYHLYRSHRDPAWIKITDKSYQDARWVRVQEKGASVALYAVLSLLLLCSVYAEYLCRILLGMTDVAVVHAIHELFFVSGHHFPWNNVSFDRLLLLCEGVIIDEIYE